MNVVSGQMMAQRFHPRVDAGFMVKFWVNGRAILAKAKDLSMAGLSLMTASPLKDEIKVAVTLPGDREIITQAKVKRCWDGVAALEFKQLDWDDMFALARYLHPRLP